MTERPRKRFGIAAAALFLTISTACAESPVASTTTTPAETTSTRSVPTTTPPVEGIVVSPEFIQGAVPGAEVVLLVSQADESAGEAVVSARADRADVIVQPSDISGIEVAEVLVVPEATDTESEMTVTIEVARAEATQTVTKTFAVVPWEDDREEQAREILGLFTSWLAEHHPDLGVTPATQFEGTYLAPQLLVVSHYGFFNDQWEIGLSWHIMIPPDDFTEIYLRPRTELRPSLAFRIDSWQTALDTGDYQVDEVDPPLEVVR